MRLLVAFDLDGVLYSTEPFLGEAYREAIAVVNARRPGSFSRVPTLDEILQHIGWPVPTILARLFPTADPEAVQLLYGVSLDVICEGVAARRGRLYEGVPETLAQLVVFGAQLVVASNGRRRYVETVLRTYDLESYFGPLLSVDAEKAPEKPFLLRGYLQRYGVGPEKLCMVGDRSSDVEAAQAVGCRFVGCDYGHGHRDEIAGHGPIVAQFSDLFAAITRVDALEKGSPLRNSEG